MANTIAKDPILNYGQLNKKQISQSLDMRKAYLSKQNAFAKTLTTGEWVSVYRDINVFDGDKVTNYEKTEGNNYKFSKSSSPTQLDAVNSYVVDGDSTVYTVNWCAQLDPYTNKFYLHDPKTPTREAVGMYDSSTDSIMLSINGPSGPAAQPFATPAWGFTTNYYMHVV